MVISLLIGVALRQKLLLVVTGMTLACAIFSASIDGFGIGYVWTAPYNLYIAILALAAINFMLMLLFWRTQKLRGLTDRWPTVTKMLIVAWLGLPFIVLTMPFAYLPLIALIISLTTLTYNTSTFLAIWQKDKRAASLLITITGFLFTPILIISLLVSGTNFGMEFDYVLMVTKVMFICAIPPMMLLTHYLSKIYLKRKAHMASARATEAESSLVIATTEATQARRQADEKTQFLSQMSHELRTPLNAIIGLGEALYQDPKMHLETRKEYLHTIASSGKHLLLLVGNILDINKLDAGKRPQVLTSFSLQQKLTDLSTTYKLICQDKGIEFKLHADNCNHQVTMDETALNQVLFNLLDNAVKFTHTGSVSLTCRAKQTKNNQFNLELGIEDTGKGIAKDAQARLFQPFEQEDNSTTRAYGGTGLGLYISRKLISKMGGIIELTSEVGHGTRFTINLTVQQDLNSIATVAANASNQLADLKLRILAVDDVAANLLVLSALLSKQHQVTQANSGQAAIDLVLEKDFDLVLMDIHMPEMSGLEATAKIRALSDPAKAKLKIVALSADVEAQRQQSFLDAGMDAALAKPISVSEINSMLTKQFLAPAAPK